MGRKVILFELNEVPYRIVDEFCAWRPRSSFARTLPACRQYETYAEDRSALSPWKTWPSVHRGVNDEKHLIHDFGQDLREVDAEYPPIWHLLAKNRVSTGVCGSLHTYPMPQDLEGYAFFLPDTFAAGSECFPKKLNAFQEFNLTMARESARNVETRVPWAAALRFLAAAPELGLKIKTFADLGGQLVSEKVQDWRTTRRRTYQSVLAFDVFMKQLETTRPSFSTFFTNHVASSMHRFWAAAFPQDYAEFGYDRRWVETYRNEIDFTMSKFDEFFSRLVAFVDRNPGYVLWVATSMGQAATVALPLETQLYVTDLERFTAAMGLQSEDWSRMPAMLPQVNLRVSESKVAGFRATVESLRIAGEKLVYRETELLQPRLRASQPFRRRADHRRDEGGRLRDPGRHQRRDHRQVGDDRVPHPLRDAGRLRPRRPEFAAGGTPADLGPRDRSDPAPELRRCGARIHEASGGHRHRLTPQAAAIVV